MDADMEDAIGVAHMAEDITVEDIGGDHMLEDIAAGAGHIPEVGIGSLLEDFKFWR